MKSLFVSSFIFLLILLSNSFPQFHDYSVKYGIQGLLLQPSTEFNYDAYKLSLMGRGFLKTELTNYLEGEIGFAIGELNGKDFNNKNWSTQIFPADLRLYFSPIKSEYFNPYFYFGLGILRWNISKFPSVESPNKSVELDWNIELPVGAGAEIILTKNTLLNIGFGYSFAKSDDLNFYRVPDANDGYLNFGIGLTFVMGSGKTDEDNDGLSKNFELEIGTNPLKNDTDEDKLFDGDEINVYKTDPLKIDSDNDGLNDYEEIKIYFSDPNSADTDGDNISDYDEVKIFNTNPSLKDTDGDGLTDSYELNVYKTNPANKDSDTDMLADNDEISKYKTDPNNSDTDGDGLLDGEEINIYKTNPLIKDAEKVPPKKVNTEINFENNEQIILEGVTFETDKITIKQESETILEKTYNYLQNNPAINIEIRGYTDNVGNSNYNLQLSQQRADEIKVWLVKKGIDALRITSNGFGEGNPIADNKTEEGRSKNRRIEIVKIK